VSRAQRQRREPSADLPDAAPAPSSAIVAVLERRGRFLTAEPLFPANDRGAGGAGGGARPRRGRIVVRGSDARGASPGELVLLGLAPRSSARVLRVLGSTEVARDVIEALMLDRGLRRGFHANVEREARESVQRVASEGEPRRDLRSLATFTIDPASARDFDDAVSAQTLPDGAARVWVHIADVAAHVREGSALEGEARRRATSVYVPGAVEPMLPHVLSSGACSLLPGQERAAVTVELEFDGARVRRAAFYRSLIRSDEGLDYEQVDRIFAGAEPAAAPWGEPLRVTREVAGALARRREQTGALVLDSSEPEFSFDEQGNVNEIDARSQTESHRLIEHLMIAANEAVAELLVKEAVPCLFRVHERPDPERVERLVDQLASLQVPTPPVPEPMSSTQAAELVAAISSAVERHVRRAGHGRLALTSLVLRSLKQAYYSPRNIGHAGLHSASYCHFTSPIRRYPDIVCHRALLASVGAGERPHRAAELPELGSWCSEREREAMQIERDADDVARCFALESLLYERGLEEAFVGEVTGLIGAGAFIAFGDHGEVGRGAPPSFEGMLPVRLLRAPSAAAADVGSRDWWELNEEGTILRAEPSGATVRLGDQLDVRVGRVDTVRGRVDLRPAG